MNEQLKMIVPWILSGIILIGYGLFIYVLINNIDSKDDKWLRLTYIFGSLETIVFTAVGFIFGKEVNRSRAIKAEISEVKANKEKERLARAILDSIPAEPSGSKATGSETDFAGLRQMAKTIIIE